MYIVISWSPIHQCYCGVCRVTAKSSKAAQEAAFARCGVSKVVPIRKAAEIHVCAALRAEQEAADVA